MTDETLPVPRETFAGLPPCDADVERAAHDMGVPSLLIDPPTLSDGVSVPDPPFGGGPPPGAAAAAVTITEATERQRKSMERLANHIFQP